VAVDAGKWRTAPIATPGFDLAGKRLFVADQRRILLFRLRDRIAGALQDHRRAIVVGTKNLLKGSVGNASCRTDGAEGGDGA